MRLTKNELFLQIHKVLTNIDYDKEEMHILIDNLLLRYIADEDFTQMIKNADLWYS